MRARTAPAALFCPLDALPGLASRRLTLFGRVHLPASMLITVMAGGGQVRQLIRATIHPGLLMLDSGASWASFRKFALAVTAFPALTPHEFASHPSPVMVISQSDHVPGGK